MAQEFFNKRPSEMCTSIIRQQLRPRLVVRTMPNIFYMQLRALYPEIAVFDDQLETMAMQWYRAVEAMGGAAAPWSTPYMNYRAWKLSTMQPLETGVPEPEAAGQSPGYCINLRKYGKEHYRMQQKWHLSTWMAYNQSKL